MTASFSDRALKRALAGLLVLGAAAVVWLWLSRPVSDETSNDDRWGPLAVVAQEGGQQALTGGRLRITDSCVYVEKPDGEQVTLVWPQNWTTWIPETREIGFNRRGIELLTLRDGQQFAFGGGGESVFEGGVPGPVWLAQTDWVSAPHAPCPTNIRWYVNDVTQFQQDPS